MRPERITTEIPIDAVTPQTSEPKVCISELLGCPWCRRKPITRKGKQCEKDSAYIKAGEWMWKPAIECKRCNYKVEAHGQLNSLNSLIAWWNDRGMYAGTAADERNQRKTRTVNNARPASKSQSGCGHPNAGAERPAN